MVQSPTIAIGQTFGKCFIIHLLSDTSGAEPEVLQVAKQILRPPSHRHHLCFKKMKLAGSMRHESTRHSMSLRNVNEGRKERRDFEFQLSLGVAVHANPGKVNTGTR